MKHFVLVSVLAVTLATQACAGHVSGPVPEQNGAARLDPRVLYQSGLALAERGDLTRAEQYLASALRAGYDEEASTRALVAVCVRASRLRSALSYASTHLADHPGDVALRRLAAALHLGLGELDEAERELARVLVSAPEDADAHYLLALVLDARTHDGAREHYARYLELAPHGRHAEEARAALAGSG